MAQRRGDARQQAIDRRLDRLEVQLAGALPIGIEIDMAKVGDVHRAPPDLLWRTTIRPLQAI